MPKYRVALQPKPMNGTTHRYSATPPPTASNNPGSHSFHRTAGGLSVYVRASLKSNGVPHSGQRGSGKFSST